MSEPQKNKVIFEDERTKAFLKIKRVAGWLDQQVNEFLQPFNI